MKIYTKKGDMGKTSLFGGEKVSKGNLRIEVYGTIDELNAHLGMLRAHDIDENVKLALIEIQKKLFRVGSQLALTEKSELFITELDVSVLEKEIDQIEKDLPELKSFIVPGGHLAVSECHIARSVCRRAERLIVRLTENEPADDLVIKYLNRLSDYLFVLARKIGKDLGVEEEVWK